MWRIIFGLWGYFEFCVSMALVLPVFALIRWIYRKDPVLRMPGRAMRSLGRFCTRLMPLWDFAIDGDPPEDISSRPYLVVSNHESTADMFLLSFLPWDMRWIAKDEIFRMPLVGWAMRLCGDLRVRRGKRESAEQLMEECRFTLGHGRSLMFFPEGKRSRDGCMLRFKGGAFRLAIEMQVPVLPIAVAGTRECLPAKSIWFGVARGRARILEPIPTEGLDKRDLATLKNAAHEVIQTASAQLRSELGLDPLTGMRTESDPVPSET